MGMYRVMPLRAPLETFVQVPGSKSESNRCALIAALASGASILSNFLLSDDTRYMLEGLSRLGFSCSLDETSSTVEITGAGGYIPQSEVEIYCGDSGTMLRFMTAACALSNATCRLAGSDRLYERPMAPLIDALRRLGTWIECEQMEGHAPVRVRGTGLKGGEVTLDGSASSQFLSSLLLVGPYCRRDLMLHASETSVSLPYVHMTRNMMDQFGVAVVATDRSFIVPAGQIYHSRHYRVEPDASLAGYFWAAAAIVGGSVGVCGIPQESIQPDIGLLEVLTQMGCAVNCDEKGITVTRLVAENLRGGSFDCSGMPDSAITLAVVSLFADSPTRITGIAHLRHKESDRLAALKQELNRLGATIETGSDWLEIHPQARLSATELDCHNDHRLAMAFALIGLQIEGISLKDPQCVSKSFPGYFAVLEQLQSRF